MVRSVLRFVFVAALVCTGTAYPQSGACAESVNVFQGFCTNTQGCQDVYPITNSNPCQPYGDCLLFPQLSTNCCGIQISYLGDWTNYCLFSLLKDKQTQSELQTLAKTEEILVPSCTGGYVPFAILRDQLGGR
jgi:hypothetical protein